MSRSSKEQQNVFSIENFIIAIASTILMSAVIWLISSLHSMLPKTLYVSVPASFLLMVGIIFFIHHRYNKRLEVARRQIEEGVIEAPVKKVFENDPDAESSIAESMKNSRRKIKIFVARATRHFGNHPLENLGERLQDKLKSTPEDMAIRILFISPYSKYLPIRADETGEDPAEYEQRVRTCIRAVACLCREHQELQIGLYDSKIIWRYFLCDDDLYVGTYPPKNTQIAGGQDTAVCLIQGKEDSPAGFLSYLAFERLFDDNYDNFKKNLELNKQLCAACRDHDIKDSKVDLLAEERMVKLKQGKGGCFGCQKN